MGSRKGWVLGLAVVVAACSIAYELVYSEMYRQIFGGAVLRYSLTIGLFLFTFGIGASLHRYVENDGETFLRVEVALALAGPLGLVFILVVNSLPDPAVPFDELVVQAVSYLPTALVGVLSGLEIPLLAGVLGTAEEDRFSSVLGADYVGSLVGTVAYALLLYPTIGLVPTVFVLGLFNAVAAVGYSARFGAGSRALVALAVLVTVVYGGVAVADDRAERELSGMYIHSYLESQYDNHSITIKDHVTTRYQNVVVYDRRWPGWEGPDTCLNLGNHVQMCESWVDSYHYGLVDVPMTFVEDPSPETKVLVIGGGDYVAVNHLREYNVTIDQVDIDGAFLEYTKDRDFFERYHDDAYEYDRLNVIQTDAYAYLRSTDEEYDVIFMDIPGIKDSKLLRLYSTEFYTFARRHLSEDGFLVTWTYSKNQTGHYRTYLDTVREAGFTHYVPYHSYDRFEIKDRPIQVERYYLLSVGTGPVQRLNRSESPAVTGTYREKYDDMRWRPIPRFEGVADNSVFHPNYDIIVDD